MQDASPRIRTRALFPLLAGLIVWLAAGRAHATAYCITTGDAAGLSSALLLAATNGESDIIKLQGGYYSIPANFLLTYSPSAADMGSDLVIAGGYAATIGDDCGLAPTVADASATVLEGGRWRTQLSSTGGSIALSGLTLQSTSGTDPTHATIELGAASGAPGDITVENVIFSDNDSLSSAAVSLTADQGAVTVRNTLFGSTVTLGTASSIQIGSARNGSFCALIVNSTVASTTGTAPAVRVSTPNCTAIVANTIFWNNAGGDVAFDAASNAYLFSNDVENPSDVTGTHITDLYSVDPQFRPDFSLSDLSALRDKGNPGTGVFSPGAWDVVGNPRIYYGVLPDIGAFEIQDVILADDFDPGHDPL